jgi:leucyl/phenylalanyl-tRNA--protein transferase
MKDAYIRLHQLGFAHSIEVYFQGELAGGLYGVSLGRSFFGESMFHLQRDASKIALVVLCKLLQSWDFTMIDSQVNTSHLISLGASEVSRQDYLEMLGYALESDTRRGKWSADLTNIII